MSETCTCGEESGQRNHYDLNWACENDNHDACEGSLRWATGFHWFCACDCHPEPEVTAKSNAERRRSVEVWRKARSVMSGAPR